jgi:SNF2 family DNA or RNA helicase
VVAPAGLGLTLRPYQLQGLAWLQYLREHHLAGILADDMGLGKTAQVLAHLLVEQQAGRMDRPSLVVLPTSLIANWQSEAARFAPALRVLTLQGTARTRDFERIAEHDVVFTTYPLLWRDISALRQQPWHLLILDEAQMVKNAGSRAAGALRRLDARHRLCVTGTPLENHLGELWAHFDLLMPGFLGDARSFARQWRKPIETNGETLRAQLLAQRVRPFILRRRKEDVATELPPKTEVIRRVQLQGEQRALYESVRVAADEQVRRVLKRQSFDGAQIAILDALLKLRQVCCDPHLLKGTKTPPTMERAKMELLREMLPELVAEGRRVLVFSQFTEMLALVQSELSALELPFLVLTGDTPVPARGDVVRRFQAKEVPLLLLSLKAGGVGLNLTAADTVIHLDPWWNPAVEQQATDRAHRIGQDQPVFVYKLVVEGSIEEKMLALQARKAALAEGVLGVDGAAASKFSAEDLQGLLAPLEA